MRNEHKYFLLAAIFIGIFATLSYIVVNTKVEIGPLKGPLKEHRGSGALSAVPVP